MNTPEWPCRIKSARRKRRLVINDRDKHLIQLDKRRDELWEQQRKLPWITLEQPYQSGWKRVFVLRDDIGRSPKAEFYEVLLTKINTIVYHHDKSFKRKKRRKGKYNYVEKKQTLREIDLYDWNTNKLALSEKEKACFTRTESFNIKTRRTHVKYIFTEPWRYVLKIKPHIITQTRPLDLNIERELAGIERHIVNCRLAPRIYLLTRGRGYWNRWYDDEPPKYINKLKNVPRYAGKEVYLELET